MAQILLLEDDTVLAIEISSDLEEAGHEVRYFAIGDDLVAYYEAFGADVVISDIIIRQHDVAVPSGGLITISRVKRIAQEQNRTVLAIAISGAAKKLGLKDLLTTARQLGADEALTKPFQLSDLRKMIERHLAGFSTREDRLIDE